ncbi:MAG: hypothetical protein ACK4K4_01415 [Caldimicrobium sp.]
MLETLRKVKEELGEEAVILDSGKITEDGQEFYEVIAAIEDEDREETLIKENRSINTYQEKASFGYEDIMKELLEIKNFLRDIYKYQKNQGLFLNLIREGVPEDIALKIENSKLEITQFIKEELRKKGVSPLSKLQVFIGEPGVGKTTSLFKIAFWYRVKKNAKILIISVDNYKIGGKEQTQKLSQFLEIPYLQSDWDDFKKYYSQIKEEYDLILMDTPSLGKKFSVLELKEVYKIYPFLRFYWVIRATEHYENSWDLWQELKDLPVEGLILSFLDRLNKGGPLFWILREDIPMPLFFSTGERIPEDIRLCEEKHLVETLSKGLLINI